MCVCMCELGFVHQCIYVCIYVCLCVVISVCFCVFIHAFICIFAYVIVYGIFKKMCLQSYQFITLIIINQQNIYIYTSCLMN